MAHFPHRYVLFKLEMIILPIRTFLIPLKCSVFCHFPHRKSSFGHFQMLRDGVTRKKKRSICRCLMYIFLVILHTSAGGVYPRNFDYGLALDTLKSREIDTLILTPPPCSLVECVKFRGIQLQYFLFVLKYLKDLCTPPTDFF